ncbi:MAG: hypothetical protein J6Q34_07740 [Bacteroidales bacterium]|nr:hypothetical protein [Bacteroidales bacterium]
MKRFYFLLVAFFVCHLHAGASSVMEIENLGRIKELINNGVVAKIDGKTQFDAELTERYNEMLGISFSSLEEAFCTVFAADWL